jgi:tetratricopeptide (TPR) repeat protein
MKSKKK